MAKKKYGFGIIGAGNIAGLHAEAIKNIPNAELVALTALPFSAAQSFAEKHGAKAYETIDELLADKNIDIITLCTPSGLHAQQAVAAAKAGKHVIVEKPVAITLEQADEVIKAAKDNNVTVGVISQRRFENTFACLKKAIDDGVLGKLVLVNGYVHYYREPSYYTSSDWRGTWEMDGGGALMNQGIHAVDLIRWLGGPVKSVSANARTLFQDIKTEDTIVASLEFENGALGALQATTSAYPGLHMRLELMGTKGTAVLEDSDLVFWKTVDGKDFPQPAEKSSIGSGAGDPMAISAAGHIAQFEDFVNALDNNRAPAIDAVEGRKAVELVLAAYSSSKSGERVCI